MDLSNRTLAMLLVASIVVSLGGTLLSLEKLNNINSLTGFANYDTGTALLNITSNVEITFTTDTINFGSGYTNDTTPGAPVENCTIDTNGTNPSADVDCVGFNSNLNPFIIRNDGNQDVTLSLKTDKDSSTFFGSSNGGVYWFVEDNEVGSCATPAITSWSSVSTTDTDACGANGFNFEDSTDEIKLHVKVDIPQDASVGSHTMVFTATGTA